MNKAVTETSKKTYWHRFLIQVCKLLKMGIYLRILKKINIKDVGHWRANASAEIKQKHRHNQVESYLGKKKNKLKLKLWKKEYMKSMEVGFFY
jgi:hypothetical protein